MKALILEDDASASIDYEMSLEAVGISSIEKCTSLEQVRTYLKKNVPDIFICDIYVGDENGMDVIPLVKEQGGNVIVVSGYPKDQFFKLARKQKIDAFLAKPLNLNTLKFELLRIKEERENKMQLGHIYHTFQKVLKRISFDDICYLETTGNYTTVYLENEEFRVKKSLRKVSEDLPKSKFIRIFRNLVINIDKVQSINFENGTLVTTKGVELSIGSTYKKLLRDTMQDIHVVI